VLSRLRLKFWLLNAISPLHVTSLCISYLVSFSLPLVDACGVAFHCIGRHVECKSRPHVWVRGVAGVDPAVEKSKSKVRLVSHRPPRNSFPITREPQGRNEREISDSHVHQLIRCNRKMFRLRWHRATTFQQNLESDRLLRCVLEILALNTLFWIRVEG
jgi:hypothetical protein